MAGTTVFAHTALLLTAFIVGVGFTRSVKLWLVPVHPFADGITVTLAVSAADVLLLVPVKEAMLPVPVDARPITPLSLVQL